MEHRRLIVICLVSVVGLVTISCGATKPHDPVSFAKADLRAMAKETGNEIAEIEVEGFVNYEAGPAERANGIEEYAHVALRFAHRCSPDEQWRSGMSGRGTWYLRKVDGKWEMDPDEGDWRPDLPDCSAAHDN